MTIWLRLSIKATPRSISLNYTSLPPIYSRDPRPAKMTKTTIPAVRRIDASEGPKAILRILDEDGGIIVRNFLSPEVVQQLNDEVDPYLNKGGSKIDDELINGGLGVRTRYLNGLAKRSKTFRDKILNLPLIHGVCEGTFREESGDYWLAGGTIIEIGPGQEAQPIHRDSMATFPIFQRMGVDAPEAMINFFIALSEFTDQNGATRVVPGSHKWPDFSKSADETVPAEMQPGDVFIFVGKVLHGGGCNSTKDNWRRGLAVAFQAAYLTPAESSLDIPREILESMTPLAQKMVAWRSIDTTSPYGLFKIAFNELGEEIGLKSKPTLK